MTDSIILEKASAARIKAAADELNAAVRRACDLGLKVEVHDRQLMTVMGVCPVVVVNVSKPL